MSQAVHITESDADRAPSPASRFSFAKLDRPAGYGNALAFVVAALVIVPILFLGVVGLFTWMSVWHLYESVAWLQEGPYFIFHLPMALIGLMLLVMLVKPLFFQRKNKDEGVIALTAAEQPRLFAFVAQLCDAAGAPRPKVIEVDCEPNAAVSITGGWRGMRRRDLALRIGLPLVVSMPLDEFAGVLAHEFGHFNQRSGLGGTFLVRSLMRFLARIVFERDRLDAMLRKLKFSNGPGKLLYLICAAMIESARGVLWLLLTICEVLTCRLLRKMEHDADQLEAQLAGSEAFVRTSEWMTMINLAAQNAHGELAEQWERRRLADNLPRLIAAKAGESQERRREIMKLIDAIPARWFHTHPSHRERIEHVRGLGLAGQLHCVDPAETLFDNIDELCLKSTEKAYRLRVGKELDKAKLVPTGPMIREIFEQGKANRSLGLFFRGTLCSICPIFPEQITGPPAEDFDAAVVELSAARDALVACGDGANITAREFARAVQTLEVRGAELTVIEFFKFQQRSSRAAAKIQKQIRQTEYERNKADQNLKPFEDASRRRLTAAVRVGLSPRMLQQLPNDGEKTQAWIRYWVGIAMFLQDALPHVQMLRRSVTRLDVLLRVYNPKSPFPMIGRMILEDIGTIRKAIDAIKDLTGHQLYPFEHGKGSVTIADALFEEIPKEKEADVASRSAWLAVERYTLLTFRSLARLTEIGEKVEYAAGLDPLPEPGEVVDPRAAEEAAARKKLERKYWLMFSGRATAGTTMLVLLAWFSFFPPDLPTMGWGGNGGGPVAYRPASFASVSTNYLRSSDPSYYNNFNIPTATPMPGQLNYSTAPTALYVNPNGRVNQYGVSQPYVEVPVSPIYGQAYQPGMPNYGQPYQPGVPTMPGQYNPNLPNGQQFGRPNYGNPTGAYQPPNYSNPNGRYVGQPQTIGNQPGGFGGGSPGFGPSGPSGGGGGGSPGGGGGHR